MGPSTVLRGEKGVSIVKTLLLLVVVAIVLYVGVNYILIRVHYLAVKDAVRGGAESASIYDGDYVKREILEKAREAKVFLTEDEIIIDRWPGEKVTVSLSYRDSLALFVKTIYFDFDVEESAAIGR